MMLMQPKSPSPDFDFMLKDNKPAKRPLPIPNLPKPVKIALAVLGILILIIIALSLLSGRKNGGSQSFINVLARAQETLRVTTLAQQLKLQDPQTQALAATVSAALSSDEKQFTSYLATGHTKVSKAQLAADTEKTTDASLQAASQNNSLDTAYANYLKNALVKYQSDLQAAQSSAGPNGQKLLTGSIESTRAIMNSAPLKGQ
jgi:hypothetical protein